MKDIVRGAGDKKTKKKSSATALKKFPLECGETTDIQSLVACNGGGQMALGKSETRREHLQTGNQERLLRGIAPELSLEGSEQFT